MAEETLPATTRLVEGVTVETFAAPGLVAVTPPKHGDARGFLSETYGLERFARLGINTPFVQDNHTFSAAKGTIRGLHFQIPPHAQGKLVRVVRGAILDVVVDIRHGSPTFGMATAVTLSADNWRQFYVPPGFAHGFCTLTDNAEVLYRMTTYYAPEADRGLAFDDPALGIAWPVEPEKAILSDKDRNHPRLGDLPAYFGDEPPR
ncbi:MAG: dTDP-4-dehydrorhamnose 3,5-epimerase [Bauldia sp.]|nr:dTDP-4-dehydrorhamnose 3,5-epimerase [Bauldia sp.]